LIRIISKRKKVLALNCIAALCLILAAVLPGLPVSAENATSSNSGLIYLDYAVYEKNSNRILTDIFSDDQFKLTVRFEKPETVNMAEDVKAQMFGGGFTGSVNSVSINTDGNKKTYVTIEFNLKYSGGRAIDVMFLLTGSYKDAGGETVVFSDQRTVAIRECHPDTNEGAEVINPSAPSEPPKFAVDFSARFPVAEAGKAYVFEIPVKNVGKHSAKEITVTIEPGESKDFPFEYDKFAFRARIAELKVNDVKTVRFEVRVLPTAKSGQTPLKINFSGRPLLGAGALAEMSEIIIITINNENTEPRLVLERIGITGGAGSAAAATGGADGAVIERAPSAAAALTSVKPGTDFTLTLFLQNSGTLAAKDISLSLKGLKGDGILTNNAPDVKYMASIDGMSSDSCSFDLTCADKMVGDRAELGLTVRYRDETGKEYTVDTQVFIPLEQTDTKSLFASFDFAGVSSPKGELTEGANFTVSFAIVNTGDVPMKDIKITYMAGTEFIGKSLNTRMLKKIETGEKVPLSFDFTVSKINASGNVPISFTVEYSPGSPDGGNGGGSQTPSRLSSTQYVGILLFKPAETTTSTTTETTTGKESVPKIIISNYSYEPKEAKAGQTVDITLTFFNTSMSQEVKNIKIQMDSDVSTSSGSYGSASSGIFTPVEGSNSFYIDRIGPRQEVERSIKLMIQGNAEARSYQLFSNIEYEDSKSTPITAKESISIPVTQVTKITINEVQINSPGVAVFNPLSVSYSYINMGKTTLYNVMASIEGENITPVQGYYSGNMTPGMQDYFDTMLIPQVSGDYKCYALIKYEDSIGNIHEERKEFTFLAMDAPNYGNETFNGGEQFPPDMIVSPEEMGGEGIMKYVNIVLDKLKDPKIAIAEGAGLLAVIIIIAALVRRKRRRRLERELNRVTEIEMAAISGNAADRGAGGPGGNAAGSGGSASGGADRGAGRTGGGTERTGGGTVGTSDGGSTDGSGGSSGHSDAAGGSGGSSSGGATGGDRASGGANRTAGGIGGGASGDSAYERTDDDSATLKDSARRLLDAMDERDAKK